MIKETNLYEKLMIITFFIVLLILSATHITSLQDYFGCSSSNNTISDAAVEEDNSISIQQDEVYVFGRNSKS